MGVLGDLIGQVGNFGLKQADGLIDRHIQDGNYKKAAESINAYFESVDLAAQAEFERQGLDMEKFRRSMPVSPDILRDPVASQAYLQETISHLGAQGKMLGQSQEMVNKLMDQAIQQVTKDGGSLAKDPRTGGAFGLDSLGSDVGTIASEQGAINVAQQQKIADATGESELARSIRLDDNKQTKRIQLRGIAQATNGKSGDGKDDWSPQQIFNARRSYTKDKMDLYGETDLMGTTYPISGFQGYVSALVANAHPRDFAQIDQVIDEMVQEANGTGDVQGGFEGQVPKKEQTTQQRVQTSKKRLEELRGSSQEEAPASQGAPPETSSKAESVSQQNANLIAEAIEASMDKSPEQARAAIVAAMTKVGEAGLPSAQALLSEAHRKILKKYQK